MTAPVVSPVVPPAAHAGRLDGRPSVSANSRRALPVARLGPLRARSTVYGLATIDCNGRLADTTVVRALGWTPGTRLDIHEAAGLVLVAADRQGVFRLTGQGHVRLPATVRHLCALLPGDRVLLAADPDQGLLVVHPPAALDAMITQFHASVWGGDAG
ncbi:MAG TPA: AbrB/MazE/SpoVT family DNA-binding domain-containing protein [Pilimelia sp.]|nr:AbrB/MazE/SpoVT family DNA-binding domain-containing protein [Pilimelia sp.]